MINNIPLKFIENEYGTYSLTINNYTLIVTQNGVICNWMISNNKTNEIEDSSYRTKQKYTLKDFDKAKEDCIKAYLSIEK